MFGCGIDVGYEAVDHAVIVVDQFNLVSMEGMEVAQPEGEVKRGAVAIRQSRGRLVAGFEVCFSEEFGRFLLKVKPPLGKADAADVKVED